MKISYAFAVGLLLSLFGTAAYGYRCPYRPCPPPPPPPCYGGYGYGCSSGLADAAAITSIVANGLSIANTLATPTVVAPTVIQQPVVYQPAPVVVQPTQVVVQPSTVVVQPTMVAPTAPLVIY